MRQLLLSSGKCFSVRCSAPATSRFVAGVSRHPHPLQTPPRRQLLQPQLPHQQQHRHFGFEYLVDPANIAKEATARNKQKAAAGKSHSTPSYKFVDRSRLLVHGGRGGRGSLSTMVLKRKHRLRPDGGHGGAGGSVLLVADPREQTLTRSHPHVAAAAGAAGTSQARHGAAGKNRVIRVPAGVVVKRVLNHDEVWNASSGTVEKVRDGNEEVDDDDNEPGYIMGKDGEPEFTLQEQVDAGFQGFGGGDDEDYYDSDDENYRPKPERRVVVLADLDEPGAHLVVARGGRGGRGTSVYASQHGALPDARYLTKMAQPEMGEAVFLELELKLIADIGLVGFPNAGTCSFWCKESSWNCCEKKYSAPRAETAP